MVDQRIWIKCGLTRSGKEISYRLTNAEEYSIGESELDFGNADDNFDAYAAFDYLYIQEQEINPGNEFKLIFLSFALIFLHLVDKYTDLNEYQKVLGLLNSADIKSFGFERVRACSSKKL